MQLAAGARHCTFFFLARIDNNAAALTVALSGCRERHVIYS